MSIVKNLRFLFFPLRLLLFLLFFIFYSISKIFLSFAFIFNFSKPSFKPKLIRLEPRSISHKKSFKKYRKV